MRLLDVYDFEIQSGFPDRALTDAQSQLWNRTASAAPHTPRYAILSHRWIGEEVTFQDFRSLPRSQLRDLPSRNPVPQVPSGGVQEVRRDGSSVFKIAGACNQVREANDKATPHIRHIWIDTVCIDKSDAQELSTSINSMFHWYRDAEVCYVYLFDVSWNGANDFASVQQFVDSEWFRRGWTLQELLAPKHVEFFDRDWKYIGAKDDLIAAIVKATRIAAEHLRGSFLSASSAQKMSWLARRETKFVEDRAYCALGIFGIFLDPRYGQGEDEFLRLQEEMIKTWDKEVAFDDSLFAWTSDRIESSGLLAPAPRCFDNAGDIIFDSKVAKRRGMDVDTARKMTFTVHWFTPIPIAVYVVVVIGTLGLSNLYPMATKLYQDHRKHREVKLNCWTQGPNGKLCAKKIKMQRGDNGIWRRVDCGRLYDSTWPKLHPSKKAAMVVEIRLKISRGITYKS